MHIAYSLLKGRAYEQIENKVHENNVLSEADWSSIKYIQLALVKELSANE